MNDHADISKKAYGVPLSGAREDYDLGIWNEITDPMLIDWHYFGAWIIKEENLAISNVMNEKPCERTLNEIISSNIYSPDFEQLIIETITTSKKSKLQISSKRSITGRLDMQSKLRQIKLTEKRAVSYENIYDQFQPDENDDDFIDEKLRGFIFTGSRGPINSGIVPNWKSIIQPEIWEHEPRKFDHTMFQEICFLGGFGIRSVRFIYPLSVEDGVALISLWQFEHLNFMHKDINLHMDIDYFALDWMTYDGIDEMLSKLKKRFEETEIFKYMIDRDFEDKINIFSDLSEQKIFAKLMRSITCSDWNKMTIDGESYGGYWASENPEEKNNAYELTYQDNFNYIYELLGKDFYYPLSILWIIKFLCSYRCEAPVQVRDFYEFVLNHMIKPNYTVLMESVKP